MLYYLAVTVYVITCVVLVLVILLQQGKGGDIANAFGGGASQAAFGARSGATVLSLVLTAWGQRGAGSVVGGIDAPAPVAPAALPSAAPAPAPSAPATSQPAATPPAEGSAAPATPPAGGTPPPPKQ